MIIEAFFAIYLLGQTAVNPLAGMEWSAEDAMKSETYTGLRSLAEGGYSVMVDGKAVAYCAEIPCPFDFPAAAGAESDDRVEMYYVDMVLEDGSEVVSRFRSDGICPVGCDSTVVVRVPGRDIFDEYRARTRIKLPSTGLVEVVLTPVGGTRRARTPRPPRVPRSSNSETENHVR